MTRSRQAFYAYLIRKLRVGPASPENALHQYGILISMEKFQLARLLRRYWWPHYAPSPEERAITDAQPDWREMVLGELGILLSVAVLVFETNESVIFLAGAALVPIAGGLIVTFLHIGQYQLITWRKPREHLVELAKKMDATSREDENGKTLIT